MEFENNNVENTNISNTNMENTNVENTNIGNTNMENTNVENTNISNTNMEIKNTKKNKPLVLGIIVLLIIAIVIVAYTMLPKDNQHEFDIAKEVKVSTNKIEIAKGESKTFVITVTDCAGLIKVSSSNNNLIVVSTDNSDCNELQCFYDALGSQASIEYTVNGIESGNADINIELPDLLTSDEVPVVGSGTIKVSVK